MTRVLQVIGQLGYGGAEILVVDIAEKMISDGVETVILVFGCCHPRMRERIELAGIQLLELNEKPMSTKNLTRLIDVLSNGRFDVVHAHLFPALYWCAFATLFTVRHGCFIYTEHSTSNGRRRHQAFRFAEHWVYRCYDHVTAVSDAAARALIAWEPSVAPRLSIIPNGIDLDRFRNAVPWDRARFGFGADDILIVFAGGFRPEKNQAALVQALACLGSHYRLALAGAGPNENAVRLLVKELGLGCSVCFLGPVEDVPGLLKAADVYVLPSLFEGFGISALEAGAAGLPVVYSEVPGLGDLFHGAGIPVQPTDPSSIAEGIRIATADAETSQCWSNLSASVAARYSLGSTTSAYLHLYGHTR